MAQFAVSAVGAAVGFAIGGPVGAQIGWAAGSVAGALLFAPDQEGPHVSDLKLPEFQYGSKLYRLYGGNRVAGTIAWFSEKRELSTTTSAKGGPEVTTHSAEIDILYILGIDSGDFVNGIARIWRNGELVWSQHDSSDGDSVTASASTDAWTDMRFLDGNASQLPDPTIEAADGVGNVSAYRHRQCAMIEGLQLGQSGQLPLMEFEPVQGTAGTALGTATYAGVTATTDGSVNFQAEHAQASFPTTPNTAWTLTLHDVSTEIAASSTFITLCEFAYTSPAGAQYVRARVHTNGSISGGLIGLDTSAFGVPDSGTSEILLNGSTVALSYDGDLTTTLTVNGVAVATDTALNHTVLSDAVVRIGDDGTYSPGLLPDSTVSIGSATFTPALVGTTLVPQTIDLADIVSAELSRGIDTADFDVTALEGIPVRGFKTTGAVRPGVEQLMLTFDFGFVCSDKLYARLLGGSSVATIPFTDLAANEDQATDTPFDPVRANDGEIPQKFLLTYPNESDDYNNGTEEGARGTGEGQATGEVAVVMTPTEAKKVAQKRAAIAGIEATTAQISLTDYYARIEPTDPITITDEDDTLYRMRVLKETYGGGVKQLDLVRDDVQVLTAPGTTSTDYSASFTVPTPADTEIVLLDTPILRDADNDPGFYTFAKGSRRGSALFSSPSDVTYTQVATFTDEATFGDCVSTLGDWTGGRKFDETNYVTVDVGSGTLSSSTRAAMLLDQSVNLAAVGVDGRWEIIQFRTATLQSEGIYKLTGLLRGGRGTEWASTDHTSGETFVLLTTAGRRVPMDTSQLGISNYYKGVTVGRLISSATAETFTDNGIGLKPFAPTKVRIARDTSGNVTFTWGRRSRLSTRFGGPLGSYAPLGETSESYTVRIYSSNTYATVVRSISATSETASYSAALQTTDFGSTQSTLYFDVVQNGALTGYATQKAA